VIFIAVLFAILGENGEGYLNLLAQPYEQEAPEESVEPNDPDGPDNPKHEGALDEYTITYYNLNGAANNNPVDYMYDVEISLVNPGTRTGYTFDGWYDAPTGGNRITAISRTDIGDKALYAYWTQAITPAPQLLGKRRKCQNNHNDVKRDGNACRHNRKEDEIDQEPRHIDPIVLDQRGFFGF